MAGDEGRGIGGNAGAAPTPQVYRLALSPSGLRVMLAALMREEQYLDEHGNVVEVAICRAMIRDAGRLLHGGPDGV